MSPALPASLAFSQVTYEFTGSQLLPSRPRLPSALVTITRKFINYSVSQLDKELLLFPLERKLEYYVKTQMSLLKKVR